MKRMLNVDAILIYEIYRFFYSFIQKEKKNRNKEMKFNINKI